MENIKDIANSIHSSIVVKVDYPTLHENNRLPILDTEMWISDIETDGTIRKQILYSYYEKEMCSKYLIHNNSAISRGSKMNILVNELLRVLRNTSVRVDEKERSKHIQHFINKMQLSGYDQEDRIKVYTKAKKIFTEKVNGAELYPHNDKFTRRKEKTRDKDFQKKMWFSCGRYKSVFFVDATPNGELAKQCQKVLNKCDLPIKVMEKTGKSLKKLLTKSNPFKSKSCGDPKCEPCLRNCEINCRAKNVVYLNYCEHQDVCDGKYIGETANAIKDRFQEHIDDYRLRPQKSSMHAHAREYHNGEKVKYSVKILGMCTGDPLLRQCMEAVAIRDETPLMNSREEWGTNKGKNPRTTLETGNKSTSNKETARKLKNIGSYNQPPSQPIKNIEEPNGKKIDKLIDRNVCWKCNLICKTERGLKIHQHSCLQEHTGPSSFLRDEIIQLNCKTTRKEDETTKVLPHLNPLLLS